MKKLSKLFVIVLLLGFVLSAQQPTHLASQLDPAVYFPCTATITADCASAWNVYDAATGQLIAGVPSTAWVGNEASIPIPAGSRRYKNAYFARVEITYFDGQKEETSDSVNVEAKSLPPAPPFVVR